MPKEKAKYIPFRCSPETAALLSQIAAAEGKSRSEVLRLLVEKGLEAGGYLPGIQGIDEVVRESVGAAIQPAVERLAAISAKAAHIRILDKLCNIRPFQPQQFTTANTGEQQHQHPDTDSLDIVIKRKLNDHTDFIRSERLARFFSDIRHFQADRGIS